MRKLILAVVVLSIGCGVSPKAAFLSAGHTIRLEEYRPASPARLPAVILLHGGDGLWLNGGRYRESARMLADQEFDVFRRAGRFLRRSLG